MITYKKTFDYYATNEELDSFVYSIVEALIGDLEDEIEVHKSRYNPDHSKVDVLYIADTISMLQLRIKEIKEDGS